MGKNTWSNIRKFTVSSGVPKTGHLSSLLISVFVNSVNCVLQHSNLFAFADDFKLFLRVNSLDDCLKLQRDLNHFGQTNLDYCLIFPNVIL